MSDLERLKKWVVEFKKYRHGKYENFFNMFNVRALICEDIDGPCVRIKAKLNLGLSCEVYLLCHKSVPCYLVMESTSEGFHDSTITIKESEFEPVIDIAMKATRQDLSKKINSILREYDDFNDLCKISKSEKQHRVDIYRKSHDYTLLKINQFL